jgi:hypothetical protein
MASRIAMVWPLTREVAGFSGDFDSELPLQRQVVVLGRRDGLGDEDVLSPAWHGEVLRARERRIADGTAKFLDLADAKQALREQLG